jgi:GNAT superfamily N-acetyltransferase
VCRRLSLFAASDADRFFVAEDGGQVVGLAVLHVSLSVGYDDPSGKLSGLVVDESHRKRGVGKALVDAVEAEARARGCARLSLTTASRRADAHAFYGRVGFEQTGRRYAKTLG